jgi:4'-phosphopantetheinyl transferase
LQRLASSLSPQEHERAGTYHHQRDRDRFLAGRGWLRRLLAVELHCEPHQVQLVTGPHGKPVLEACDLRFNAARSAGLALYATSWHMDIGVDIEAIRASADVEGIAGMYFSPHEQRALSALPPAKRLTAFFQCWTCKEAYGKGIGTGLDFPLTTIDVWHESGEPTTVSEWTIHQVHVAPGFAAAVAGARYDGPRPNVHAIRVPDS